MPASGPQVGYVHVGFVGQERAAVFAHPVVIGIWGFVAYYIREQMINKGRMNPVAGFGPSEVMQVSAYVVPFVHGLKLTEFRVTF